jgi:hypothetical protein
MEHRMNKAYFITATGTDLGKTWVAAGLVAACRARGVPARAEAGDERFRPDPALRVRRRDNIGSRRGGAKSRF